jgi:transcriptional regulator with XRE-family HTH domain
VSEPGGAGPTPDFIARLGEQLRSRRKDVGWTVQQLAERSGVSRRMLTQIELGQANPSLVTVDKLARALGTDFASLSRSATTDDGTAPLTVGAPDPPGVWSSPAGSRATLQVATTLQPPAELWSWTLQPADAYQAEPDPTGSQELFLVLEGTLTIAAADLEPVTLPPGATARLASDRPYRYENRTAGPVRFVRVVQLSR